METINYSVRINPIIPKQEKLESTTITINKNNNTILFNNIQLFNSKIERFFNEKTTQKEVYDYIEPILYSTLNNINSTVLILGERESGKNYTMLGEDWCLKNKNKNSYQNDIHDIKENIGIIPRFIIQLINNITEEIKISCNYFMIFNENVYDLLNDNINNLTKFENLIFFDCSDLNDLFIILKKGKNNILKKLNHYPEIVGKYHIILTIHYEDLKKQISSKTNFCIFGDGYFESTNDYDITDNSLLYLRKFINSIQDKQEFFEFEKSILINYLKDSIGEKYKTFIIVQIINYTNEEFNCDNFDNNDNIVKEENILIDDKDETNTRKIIKLKRNDNITFEDKETQIGQLGNYFDNNILLMKNNKSHTTVEEKNDFNKNKKVKRFKRNKKMKIKEDKKNINKKEKEYLSFEINETNNTENSNEKKLKYELFPSINKERYKQNIKIQLLKKEKKNIFVDSFYNTSRALYQRDLNPYQIYNKNNIFKYEDKYSNISLSSNNKKYKINGSYNFKDFDKENYGNKNYESLEREKKSHLKFFDISKEKKYHLFPIDNISKTSSLNDEHFNKKVNIISSTDSTVGRSKNTESDRIDNNIIYNKKNYKYKIEDINNKKEHFKIKEDKTEHKKKEDLVNIEYFKKIEDIDNEKKENVEKKEYNDKKNEYNKRKKK